MNTEIDRKIAVIFVATLATILLVTKLEAKPKKQPKRFRVKEKRY